MKNETKRLIRIVGTIIFLLYLGVLAYFLFFSEAYGRGDKGDAIRYNLTPFFEIWRFSHYRELVGSHSFLVNVYGNILAFVPFGFFLPVLFRNIDKGIRPVICGFLFSLMVETIQLVSRVGIFDVDDLILNTAGVLAGFLVFRFCNFLRLHAGRYEAGKE